jgi:hypothetical protein
MSQISNEAHNIFRKVARPEYSGQLTAHVPGQILYPPCPPELANRPCDPPLLAKV